MKKKKKDNSGFSENDKSNTVENTEKIDSKKKLNDANKTVYKDEEDMFKITLYELKSGELLLKFEGELTIYTVPVIVKTFETIQKSSSVIADLSQITKIDTAGFQLLLYLKSQMEKQGKSFSYKNPCLDVLEIFQFYGESISNQKYSRKEGLNE